MPTHIAAITLMPETSDSSPAAKGRCFLRGWARSASMSTRSFTKYDADAHREKTKNASSPVLTRDTCNWCPRSIGTNTSTFFDHWYRRSALIQDLMAGVRPEEILSIGTPSLLSLNAVRLDTSTPTALDAPAHTATSDAPSPIYAKGSSPSACLIALSFARPFRFTAPLLPRTRLKKLNRRAI